MAEKIKRFFEKKKRDAKFKSAGPGHKLSEPSDSKVSNDGSKTVVNRVAPTDDAKKAGIAALSRLAITSHSYSLNLSVSAMEAQQDSAHSSDSRKDESNSSHDCFAAKGIFFKCPFLNDEILPKEEWKAKIREFLTEQLEFEGGLTSCLMIHTLNRPQSKVDGCVSTLSTYIKNIMSHPNEEKYRKIRLENKVFKEKVAKIEGAMEFLKAAGFVQFPVETPNGTEEFLVFDQEEPDLIHLQSLLDGLENAEPISLSLDRNVQVLNPAQALDRTHLPDEFYALTSEEIKREQLLRSEKTENMMQLKTKAMRLKEEMKEKRKYKYAIIRIRFPDGIILQGTFSVYESLKAVKEFILENLESQEDFILTSSLGTILTEDESTLVDLNLVPASVLTFRWLQEPEENKSCLNEELLTLLQPL